MKIMPSITTLLMLLVLSISNSFAAVNGQFKGTIDGNVIDIPVSCDYSRQVDLGMISITSDGRINPLDDKNKDGIAMDLNFVNEKYFIAEMAVKGELYHFNGIHEVNGSRFAYKKNKGLLKNKIKYDYEVDFVVTCNK